MPAVSWFQTPLRNHAETIAKSEKRNHAETAMKWAATAPKPSAKLASETTETIPYGEGETVSAPRHSLNTRYRNPSRFDLRPRSGYASLVASKRGGKVTTSTIAPTPHRQPIANRNERAAEQRRGRAVGQAAEQASNSR